MGIEPQPERALAERAEREAQGPRPLAPARAGRIHTTSAHSQGSEHRSGENFKTFTWFVEMDPAAVRSMWARACERVCLPVCVRACLCVRVCVSVGVYACVVRDCSTLTGAMSPICAATRGTAAAGQELSPLVEGTSTAAGATTTT